MSIDAAVHYAIATALVVGIFQVIDKWWYNRRQLKETAKLHAGDIMLMTPAKPEPAKPAKQRDPNKPPRYRPGGWR